MGTSENRRENGQQFHLPTLSHHHQHHASHHHASDNQHSHLLPASPVAAAAAAVAHASGAHPGAAASPHMHPLDARQQVYPADWHARAAHPQSLVKCEPGAPSEHAASGAQSMEVDQQFDAPEAGDDRRSPVSPSSVMYERSASFGARSSAPSQHPQHMSLRPFAQFETPVSRFKAAHGYAHKPHEELLSPSSGDPACQSPANSAIRLPSLAYPGTPPLSPHHWSSGSPRGSFGEAFPSPRRGFPLTASESMRQLFPNSASAGIGSPSQQSYKLAPLRRGNESPVSGSLPSLASLATSLPESNASVAGRAVLLDQVGGPFPYERAQSCPSDEYRGRPMPAASLLPEPAPLYVIKSNVPKNGLVRSFSVDGDTAMKLRPRSLMAPSELAPAPQRSPSGPEPEAIQRWLEPREARKLNSLAESAHTLHLLERSQSPSLSSGPSSPLSAPREDDDAAFPAEPKREKKLCSFPQCTSNAVTRGKCISHGGGRRCQRKGCTRGAQSKGLCVAHGGGRICHERGCSNIQRSMGLCIRHGGGKRCSMPGCQKGVVRQDLCTAHGGKRKCRVEDCTKHVKKRGLCRSHANSMFASSA